MTTVALPPIAANTWTDPAELAMSPFGVMLVPDAATAPLCVPTPRSSVRGTGISTANDGRISGLLSEQCYIGAKLGSSDSRIYDTDLKGHRDACLWIVAGSANNVSTGNHYFGSRIPGYNEGSQQFRSVNDTFADSLIGYFGDVKVCGSHQTTLTNVLFQHNMVRDCVFGATCGQLVNCIVNVQRDVNEWNTIDIPGVITRSTVGKGNAKVGVELGTRCGIRGGVVELFDWKHPLHTASGRPCECVRVMPGSTSVVIDTLFVDSQGLDGAIGVHLLGPCHGLKVDCFVYGFGLPAERLLVIDDPIHSDGLDITFRVSGKAGPIGNYIKTGPGWSGSIRVVGSDKTVVLQQGKGA